MTGKIKRVIKRIGGRKAFSILAGVKSFMQDLLWGKAMLKKRLSFTTSIQFASNVDKVELLEIK